MKINLSHAICNSKYDNTFFSCYLYVKYIFAMSHHRTQSNFYLSINHIHPSMFLTQPNPAGKKCIPSPSPVVNMQITWFNALFECDTLMLGKCTHTLTSLQKSLNFTLNIRLWSFACPDYSTQEMKLSHRMLQSVQTNKPKSEIRFWNVSLEFKTSPNAVPAVSIFFY